MAQRTLNLDELLLEPGRIIAPDGSSASLREYSEDDVVVLLHTLQSIQGQPEASSLTTLADAIIPFFADVEQGRRVVDSLPVTRLMDIIIWLQTADSNEFAAPTEPDGEIVLNGATRAVRLVTVGTFRKVSDTAQVNMTGDVTQAVTQNAEIMASMIEGMTAEQWRSLPRQRSAAIERYITELMSEASAQVAAVPKATPRARKMR